MRNIKGRNLQMEEKLSDLYLECALELEKIGINIQNTKEIGVIDISISRQILINSSNAKFYQHMFSKRKNRHKFFCDQKKKNSYNQKGKQKLHFM